MNAYSIIHNYDQPVYTSDFNLVQTALGMKQQRLDTNRAKIQSVYDQYASLQVRNEFYQNYIGDHLQQVLDINKQYHNLDLSDSNFASAIAGNVSQILDDQVMGAIMDTKRMDAEDKEWEEKRLKGDGSYNRVNHEYALAMSDRQRYLQTADFDNRYQGGASFIEYTDYSKKWNEVAKDIEKRLGAKYFEQGPNAGVFRYIDSGTEVKAEDLRSELQRVFSSKDLMQMQIDGWDNYRNLPTENFKQEWDSYHSSKVDVIDYQRSALESYRNSGKLTQTEIDQIDAQLNSYDSARASLEGRMFSKGFQAENLPGLYGHLFTEKYMDGIVSTYAGRKLESREIDKAHMEGIKFNFDVRKHNESMRLAQDKFLDESNYRKAKLLLEGQKEGLRFNEKTGQWESMFPAGTGESGQFIIEDNKQYEGNPVRDALDNRSNAITNLKSFWSPDGKSNWLSTDQFNQLVTMYKNDPTILNKSSIKLPGDKGRVLQLDGTNREALASLLYTTTKSDPIVDLYVGAARDVIVNYVGDFAKMYSNSSFRQGIGTAVPTFDFTIVNEGGNLVAKPLPAGQGAQEYRRILEKKNKGQKLTPAEQKTIEAQTGLGFALSAGANTKERREAAYRWVTTELLADVAGAGKVVPSFSDKNKVASSKRPNLTIVSLRNDERINDVLKEKYGNFQWGRDVVSDNDSPFTNMKGYGIAAEEVQTLQTLLDTWNRNPTTQNLNNYYSKFLQLRKASETNYKLPQRGGNVFTQSPWTLDTKITLPSGETINLNTPRQTADREFTRAEFAVKAEFEKSYDKTKYGNIITNQSHPELYSSLVTMFGFQQDVKKGEPLLLVDRDGAYFVNVKAPKTETKNAVFNPFANPVDELTSGPKGLGEWQPLTQQQVNTLRANGLLESVERKTLPGMDARGQALPLNLGNTATNSQVKRKEHTDILMSAFENTKQKDVVKQEIDKYLRGDYKVSIEADGERYYPFLKDANGRVISFLDYAQPPVDIDTRQYLEYVTNLDEIKLRLMYTHLQNILGE